MQKIRSGNENDCKTRTGSFTQFLVGPAQTLQEPFLKGASPGPQLQCQVGSRQGFPVLASLGVAEGRQYELWYQRHLQWSKPRFRQPLPGRTCSLVALRPASQGLWEASEDRKGPGQNAFPRLRQRWFAFLLSKVPPKMQDLWECQCLLYLYLKVLWFKAYSLQ